MIKNLLLAFFVSFLSACGGGDSPSRTDSGLGSRLVTAKAGGTELLATQALTFVSVRQAANSGAVNITVDQLFDWAEVTFPELFPSRRTSQLLDPYTYRYYPETDLYVGVASNEVFLLGAVQTEGKIVKVGLVSDYVAQVLSSNVITELPEKPSTDSVLNLLRRNASAAVISATVLIISQ